MPIVIGDPVGLAAGADADAPPPEPDDELEEPPPVAAAGVVDVELDAFVLFELHPASRRAPTASTAVDAAGTDRLAAPCNRLCETIKSLRGR
jgi:hypothetical protein